MNGYATNWGKGRLTKLQSQSMIIDLAYDRRGNIKSDKRTLATQVYTTTYEYDLADRITKVNYPSGRIVTYSRDTDGRINQVTTKQNTVDGSICLLPDANRQVANCCRLHRLAQPKRAAGCASPIR